MKRKAVVGFVLVVLFLMSTFPMSGFFREADSHGSSGLLDSQSTADPRVRAGVSESQFAQTQALGLVGYWKLDEGSGATAYDSSGSHNHGIIYGASWTSGKASGALSFDGVDDYVDCGTDPSLMPTTAITLEAWFKASAVNTYGTIISTFYYEGYFLRINPNAGIEFAPGMSYSPPGIIQTGVWYHVAGTFDGTSKSKLYVNGKLVGSQGAGYLAYTGQSLRIGNNPTTDLWFNGIIDEVKVYNRALSAEEIRAEYTVGTDWWPMFHHAPNHTGSSTSTRAPTTNQTLWHYLTGSWVASSPAVVDGVVYVGSGDWNVYALNASTGTKIWNRTANAPVYSSPAVADGKVYVGSGDIYPYYRGGILGTWETGGFYCLNASSGALIWGYYSTTPVESSPAVADGMVFVGDCDNTVYAFNASDGEFIWAQSTGGWVLSSPAVADGMVFVGANDSKVYAFNEFTGEFKWSYTTGNLVDSSPAVADGTVFVGSCDNKVYALNEFTGALKWSYTTGSWVESSPAVVDGVVYVGSDDWNVYALNASTGKYIWNCQTVGQVYSSPAVADGKVYVGSWNDGGVNAYAPFYCLNASNGGFIWSYKTNSATFDGSPAIVGGVVYVGADDPDNHVYAFESNTTIMAYCVTETAYVNVGIALDGSPTGYTTPHTFTSLSTHALGTHTITVPNTDPSGHPFKNWNTGETSSTITVSYAGFTYIAYYEASSVPTPYDVTISAYCYTEGLDPAVQITMDNVVTAYTTPYTFTGLVGTHTFTVPAADPSTHEFVGWSMGAATLNITVSPSSAAQNYTVYYEGVFAPNPDIPPDNETTPPSYDVTIDAYCLTERLDPHVSITMDGVSTGFVTPHTFKGLVGNHSFAVPAQDSTGHSFMKWSTGAATITITVSPHWPPATYTAWYLGTYDVTIDAYCYSEGLDPHVSITMDGVSTGFVTPHTFTGLVGTHTFAVPAADPSTHGFIGWGQGTNANPITVAPAPPATYTAYYEGHSYDVTIDAYCYSEGLDPHVSITMDGVSTGFVTPHTFTGLVGTHTFTVPAVDPKSHWFFGWSTGAATLSITVSPHWPPATYTAYYEGVYRLIIPPAKTPPYTPTPTPTPTTIPTPGKYYRWYLTRVTVTAIPSPGYVLDFWILDDVKLPPSNPFQFEFPRDLLPLEPEFQFFSFELAPEFSFSRMPGDINDDGVVDILDALLLAGAFLSTPGSPRWNPNADLNNDGIVDIFDALLLARYFGQHFP